MTVSSTAAKKPVRKPVRKPVVLLVRNVPCKLGYPKINLNVML